MGKRKKVGYNCLVLACWLAGTTGDRHEEKSPPDLCTNDNPLFIAMGKHFLTNILYTIAYTGMLSQGSHPLWLVLKVNFAVS